MTNRPLTATELAKARHAYQLIGECYPFTNAACKLVDASNFLSLVVGNRTTDGKPLRSDRVPTAADIGKRVKVQAYQDADWQPDWLFCGFCSGMRFLVENCKSGALGVFDRCIIDEEAAQ